MAKYNSSILEICTNSVNSVWNAYKGGAHRVELCSNLEQGGTTPSAGMILSANQIPIEIHVLIRPRIGGFTYSEQEYETIKADVLFCKENGCEGVVIGFLNEDETIDINKTKEIVSLASPMEVTFHRAFDCVENPFDALETIIAIGCHRILTSGLESTAIQGKELIGELIKKADNRITIMGGAGINYNNIKELHRIGLRAFHSSASVLIQQKNQASTKAAKGFYLSYKETHLEQVQLLKAQIEKLDHEH